MNKNLKFVFLPAFVLSICLSLAAQEKPSSVSRTLTEKEYFSTIRRAYDKTRTRKHRIKHASEKNAPDAADKRLLLTEFVPPNRERNVFDFYEGDELRRYEELSVGRMIYVKYDSEDWRRKTEPDVLRAYSKGSDVKTERLFAGNETVNGQPADLYQKTETSGYPHLPNSQPMIEIEKYWINADGLIVKHSFSTTDSSLGNFLNRTEDYEYDASIQINAPATKAVRRKKLEKR